MRFPTKTLWIVLAALLVGCGGQSGTGAPETAADVAAAEAEPEPPRPAVPLLEADPVSLTQYDRFTQVQMDGIPPRRVALERIVPLLPSKLQAPYRAALGEEEKLRPLAKAAREADGKLIDCEVDADADDGGGDCSKLHETERAASKELYEAQSAADKRVSKVHELITEGLESGGSDAPAYAVASAFLYVADNRRDRLPRGAHDDSDVGYVPALPYGELNGVASSAHKVVTEAFEEAKQLTKPGTKLGALVRYKLFEQYWREERADDALEELAGLLEGSTRRQVEAFLVEPDGLERELLLKRAFLHTTGAEPDHAKAADAFRRLLPEAPERGRNDRQELRQMIMLAQYRAHQFDAALVTALEILAPPPSKAGQSRRFAISRFRILGTFSSSAARPGESSGARRIAADCMERLGSEADIASAPAELQSELLNILGTRALFRRDLVQAKAYADEALGMVSEGCIAARAYKTLLTVAELENEAELRPELLAALEKARGKRRCSLDGPAGAGGILAALLGPATKAHEAEEEEEEEEEEPSVAERRIEALSRLCLEPDHWQIPMLRDGDVSVSVSATAYDRGPAKVTVAWQPWEVVSSVTKCFEEMGTAYFSGAPESVRAEIDLENVTRSESSVRMGREMSKLGALFGDQIGKNFGYGGLGLRGSGIGGGGSGGGGGLGGLGSRGSGRGGGGTGQGTIGLGNLGTIGHGGGGGSGSGYGRGSGGLRGRRTAVPRITFGQIRATGRLSVEVVRRYLRRHINQLRFCYEQQLTRTPSLSGRVTVEFVISGSGAVTSARVTDTTLSNSSAEACVTRAVQRVAFPQPEGGGQVTVTFPVTFAPSS